MVPRPEHVPRGRMTRQNDHRPIGAIDVTEVIQYTASAVQYVTFQLYRTVPYSCTIFRGYNMLHSL